MNLSPETLRDISDSAKATFTYAFVFVMGMLLMFVLIARDPDVHVVMTDRDCRVQHSFVADNGERFYCAPWVEFSPAVP